MAMRSLEAFIILYFSVLKYQFVVNAFLHGPLLQPANQGFEQFEKVRQISVAPMKKTKRDDTDFGEFLLGWFGRRGQDRTPLAG